MPARRFLVVEDDESIGEIVLHIAQGAGFLARMANSTPAFLSLYESFQPEIIALDIVMPGMDGFEILRFLKKNSSQARIIILSGDQSFRRMAEELGVGLGFSIVANIHKPFRVADMRRILEEIQESFSDYCPLGLTSENVA